MNARAVIVILAVAVLVLLGWYFRPQEVVPFGETQTEDVRQLVEGFGEHLQNVSLLGSQTAAEMQVQYSDFVAPELLATWQSDPQSAPGRMTSSPWPEEIEITSIEQVGEGAYYHVEGFVIEVSNEGGGIGEAPREAARRPITLTVQETAKGLRITEVMLGVYPGDGEWTYTEPNTQGLQVNYPRELPTTYISASSEGWPPTVDLAAGEYSCAEQDERMVGDRSLCLSMTSEGAAGSTYRTYQYTTQQGDFLASVTFTLRFPQCANYDEPQRSACATEQLTFDIDGLADRMLSSIRML